MPNCDFGFFLGLVGSSDDWWEQRLIVSILVGPIEMSRSVAGYTELEALAVFEEISNRCPWISQAIRFIRLTAYCIVSVQAVPTGWPVPTVLANLRAMNSFLRRSWLFFRIISKYGIWNIPLQIPFEVFVVSLEEMICLIRAVNIEGESENCIFVGFR